MATSKTRRGSSALDPLMAGFAGGAAAFIIYAMPQPNFDGFIALSGLPMVVSAAQPPLGMTARVAVMIATGLAAFAIVWFVLRALGKPSARTRKRAELEELEMAPPRLRRADMHPDAPSRRPILAGVDLGRSFDELPTDRDPTDAASVEEEVDANLDEEPLRPEGEPLYAPSAYGIEAATEETPQAPAEMPVYIDIYEREAASAHEAVVATAAEPEPDFESEPDFEPEPEHVAEEAPVEPEAFEEPEDEQEEEAEDLPFHLAPRHAETVEALRHRLPTPQNGKASIPDLMNRLEAGLAGRRPSRWMQPASDHSNGSSASHAGDPLDARLRGAIDELQRLASRGN